jgi:O-antigen/teichoic acid export membrane protein
MAQTFSSNVRANGILQFLNLAFPVISLPFLAHVLSPESFGAVNFFSFLVGNFSLVVQYGFEYSATRKLGDAQLTPSQRADLFSEVMSAKIFLAVASFFLYLPLLALVADIQEYAPIALATFAITFSFALNPLWYVLGVQEMPKVVWRHLIPKGIFLSLVFVVIQSDQDAYRYPALIALAIGTSSIATWHWITQHQGIRWKWVSFDQIFKTLKQGFFVFGVSLLSVFYQTIGALLLAQLVDYSTVGTYTLGWRVMNLYPALALVPVLQALFPRMGEQIRSGKYSIPHLLNRTLSQLLAFVLTLMLLLTPLVPWLLRQFFDPAYQDAWYIYLGFLPFILLNCWNQLLANQLFLNLSQDKLVFRGYAVASMIALGISWFAIPLASWAGVLWGLYGAEGFLALYFGYQAVQSGKFRWHASEWLPKAWLVPMGRQDLPVLVEDPKISLIIPTYLRPEVWPPLVQSIQAQTKLPDEVVVIDQHPDGAQRQQFQTWLTAALPGIPCVFPMIERPNRCLAKETGLRAASGPLKVLIDDDVILHPDFIHFYSAHLQAHPWDLLTTQLLEPGVVPEPKRQVARYTWYGYFYLNHHSSLPSSHLSAVTGACFGFYHHAGIVPDMDANLVGQGIKEEVDFTYTMAQQGYHPVYRPAVPTRHFPQSGGNQDAKARHLVKWMAEAYYNFGWVHQKHGLLHLQILRTPYVYFIGIRTMLRAAKTTPGFKVWVQIPGYVVGAFWRGYFHRGLSAL